MNCITDNNYDNWSENKNDFTISQEIATVYLLSIMLFGDFGNSNVRKCTVCKNIFD